MDMSSGGGEKEKWAYIYIEAPEDEAIVIFYNRFGHSPNRVTCTCCGSDYSINEGETVEQLSAYERGCTWAPHEEKYIEKGDSNRYKTLEEFLKEEGALMITKNEIKPKEREGSVPDQGYVWVE